MKGINGLILAIFLAVAGAVFNFLYLASRSSEVNMVGFVGIAEGKEIKAGQRLTEDKLVKVEYTERDAKRLEKSAYAFNARSSLIGQKVWHNLIGPTLVVRDDMQTPLVELDFGRHMPEGIAEIAVPVPIEHQENRPLANRAGRRGPFRHSTHSGQPSHAGATSGACPCRQGGRREERAWQGSLETGTGG